MKKYAQFDASNIIFSVVESASPVIGADVIEVDDYSCLGKKWDGLKFVDAPKRYKIWSKTAFVTICGRAVFDAIVDGVDKDLRYFKYILDSADIVDLNVPQYFGMVKLLNDKKIMSDPIFTALTVQE